MATLASREGPDKDRPDTRSGGRIRPFGQRALPGRMPRPGWRLARVCRDACDVIHDVDQLLEKIVRRDALNGSAVELVFEAPTKDWVARRSGPAIDLYLYDIREDLQRRVPAWEDVRGKDGLVAGRAQPPRRFKLAYLVTAWTQRPEDEHRLLSSLLVCFLRNPMIKPGELGGSLDETDLPVYIDVGQPATQERSLADIWSALGGELKPSLDLVVTAPIAVTRNAPFGPPIFEGPDIGIASTAGAAERGLRRGRAGVELPPLEPMPEEVVPLGAGGKDGRGGVQLRVKGHRRP